MKKNYLLMLPLICTVFTSCSSGGSISSLDTNSQLEAKLQKLSNDFLITYQDSSHVSAMPILAKCGGKLPVYIYNGTMSYGSSRPINENSLFQIGSITKSFTSVILLQLAAESNFNYSLEQPIGQWLTNLPIAWQNITTRQLMHMVSGIPSYTNDEAFMETYVYNQPYSYHDLEFFALSQADKPTLFAPGENYNYSNTNYTLMGMLVEKITGKSVYYEIEKRIIEKLGLSHTYFPDYLPEMVANPANLVSGYFVRESSIKDIRLWTLSPMNSGGGIISNINDINTYLYNLYTPGKLLNQDQLEQLTSLVSLKNGQPIKSLSESDPAGFGLGIFAAYVDGRQLYTYTGATLGFNFTYYYDPNNHDIVIYTANVSNTIDQSYNTSYGKIGIDIMSYLESNC